MAKSNSFRFISHIRPWMILILVLILPLLFTSFTILTSSSSPASDLQREVCARERTNALALGPDPSALC